jgi:hypothetical protein
MDHVSGDVTESTANRYVRHTNINSSVSEIIQGTSYNAEMYLDKNKGKKGR